MTHGAPREPLPGNVDAAPEDKVVVRDLAEDPDGNATAIGAFPATELAWLHFQMGYDPKQDKGSGSK